MENRVIQHGLSRIDFTDKHSVYINAKIIGEYIVNFAARENGFKAIIIRPSITYTPFIREDDPRLHNIALASFLTGRKLRMKSSGEASRNFLFVLDFLRALNLLIAVPDRIVTANVTNPVDTIVREFVSQIASIKKNSGQFEVVWNKEDLVSGTNFRQTRVVNRLLDNYNWRPIWDTVSAFQYISMLYEGDNDLSGVPQFQRFPFNLE
jgi:nucleoside-diphosphate-sugar epimerase